MGVSINRGTSKSSILIGISLINHPFRTPMTMETPIFYHIFMFGPWESAFGGDPTVAPSYRPFVSSAAPDPHLRRSPPAPRQWSGGCRDPSRPPRRRGRSGCGKLKSIYLKKTIEEGYLYISDYDTCWCGKKVNQCYLFSKKQYWYHWDS